ncbi:MAG: GLUG motif-containing protein, partial [Planctomycetota bacterium]
MYSRLLLFIIVLLSLISSILNADDPSEMQWHKGYGTTYGNHVHEGMQTSDGGYIGIGQTWDSSDYPQMLVIKTDSSGNKDWQKVIGTSNQYDIGICVAEVSDGFLCGGGLYDSPNMKRALVKLNKTTGNIVSGWPKYYSGSQNCCIRGIEILGDGSIVTTGYKSAPEPGFLFICDDGDGFIMKTNAAGTVQWDKGLSVPQGTKVRQDGSGFAVCSTDWYFDGGDHQDAVLIKTDSSGNETNKYHFGGTGGEHCYDFDLTFDGGYILGGHTTSYGVANWDYYLVKVNSSGVEQWHKTFGQPRGYDADYIHDEAYGVRQTPDGGYIIAGGSGDEYPYSECGHPAGCSDEWKAYTVRTDGDGNKLWEDVYPPTSVGNTACEYIGLTSDNGYILFNDTDAFYGTVGAEAFGFMKLSTDPSSKWPSGGTGGSNDPYRITTPEDVNLLGKSPFRWDKYFVVVNDINLAGWDIDTIGDNTPFTGVFDGNDHTISGLSQSDPCDSYIGLFGNVQGPNALIKDLHLYNIDLIGDFMVGSLVGKLSEGSITNCTVRNSVVSGNSQIGGLIGYADSGSVTDCYSEASVTGGDNSESLGGLIAHSLYSDVNNCYALASVTGGENAGYLGGLIGRSSSSFVDNCYALADVNAAAGSIHVGGLVGRNFGSVANSYAKGTVSGDENVGGLVGYNGVNRGGPSTGTIFNCYAAANITA